MTISQTVINERCNRWLADILERRSVPNPHDLAKHITTELLAQGLAPVPRPFPLRSTAPSSTPEGRAAARAEYERSRAERKAADDAAVQAKLTRVGPPPTPGIEDLAAGAKLLGLDVQVDDTLPPNTLEIRGADGVAHRVTVPDLIADAGGAVPYPAGETATYPVHSGDPLDDDVVDAVIHEADCPGGDCQCGLDVEPVPEDQERALAGPDEPVPDAWGPDDPPF